jgi:hypothetical protein
MLGSASMSRTQPDRAQPQLLGVLPHRLDELIHECQHVALDAHALSYS